MEGWEIIKTDQGNSKVLKNIFSKLINYISIPQYNQAVPISKSAKDPLIKATIKDRNHPSIIEIKGRRIPNLR